MKEVEFPEKLHFLITDPARYKVLYGGRGGMKCLGLGTKVIMFDGSLKAVEDIKNGDLLMGPDGLPRRVSGITRGKDIMFKISQTSGIDYICSSNHILSLKKSKSAIIDGRYKEYSTVTNISVTEANCKTKRWKNNFRGYKAGLLKFSEKPITIDPWFLGLWLGDGKSSDTIIYSADEEILNSCKEYASKLGLEISIYLQPNNKSIAINLRKVHNNGYRTNILTQQFKSYELFNNKHIPINFKTNCEKVRLELLAGIIDSDGIVHNNGYDIYQTNEILARDIKYVADTLGFRTNISENKTKCSNQVVGKAFRVSINGDTWRIPCRVKRKIIKKEAVIKNKDFLLSQIKIEEIGYGEYAGFSLDGDNLFLLEDGTVTHNTESIARALVILSVSKKLRIACFREFHKSIDQSVYPTIVGAIHEYGLSDQFKILDKSIICIRTGSEFIFAGLRYNIDSIKSMARIDIAWVEEARNISKTSIEKLGPTIRGRHESDPAGMGGPFGLGPEIWLSFNPELDTDEVYKRFILKKDLYAPDFVPNEETGELERYAYVVKVGWQDNKWFPADMRRDMLLAKKADEDEWLYVWEGHTKQTLDGAIYAKEIKKVLLDGRRGSVPYDPSKPVYTFWDLGHADHTSIWFVQRIGMYYNLINFYQNRLQKITHYLEYIQELKYNYGYHHLPHDAENETLASRSVAKFVRDAYPGKVKVVPRVAKKEMGIKAAREIFDFCNFDENSTSEGWQCLCRYQYEVDEDGQFSRNPLHNEFSDGADAFQTIALSLKTEMAATRPPSKIFDTPKQINKMNTGWMGNM